MTRRIEQLERENAVGMRVPRIWTVYSDEGDADEYVEAQVAKWRAENRWPDDGAHPLSVIHVVYVDPPVRQQ